MCSRIAQCTKVRFASFLSGGFINAIVVNPPERKLVKRTFVHCAMREHMWSQVLSESQQCFIRMWQYRLAQFLLIWGIIGHVVSSYIFIHTLTQ